MSKKKLMLFCLRLDTKFNNAALFLSNKGRKLQVNVVKEKKSLI